MFEHSPVSKDLFRHFNRKFGQVVTPKALCKCCVVVSSKLERPRFSLMDVAPSRNIKSYSSNDVMEIFDPSFYINIGSDFTMHGLYRYKKALIKGKCLFVNDGNTEFASKTQRGKDRLVSGLSELLADEIYDYKDFGRKMVLRGKVTIVMNLVSEVYKNYKDRLFGLTLSERFFIAHHALTRVEQRDWVRKVERADKIRFKEVITEDDIETDVEIPRKYYDTISHLSEEYSYLSLRTFMGCQDIIKAMMMSHASLNGRDYVGYDDIGFVKMMKAYLVNPFSPYEGEIVKLRSQGYSFRDICKILNKPNYLYQVQSVVKKATIRGVLPLEKAVKPNTLPLRKSTIRPKQRNKMERRIVELRKGRVLE